MKKFTFLLVLIGLSIWSFSQINQRITPKRPAGKKLQQVSESRAAYDVFWEEDFTNVANGGDADEGWTYMDIDDHGFVYIDADTIFSNENNAGGEAEPGVNMIEDGSPNGYLHFPIQHYNCVPDIWPRVLIAEPLEMDASIESPWIPLAGAPENTCLQFSTLWFLCCSPAEIKIDVNITTDGENWITFDGFWIDGGPISYSSKGDGIWKKNITEYIEGAEQLKIQIHVYGVKHYFFSVDDIQLVELPLNDLSLVECFSSTELASLVEQSYFNTNYSEVPANIKTTVYMGAKVKQEGLDGENVRVEFEVDRMGVPYWPENPPAISYTSIPSLNLFQDALLMVSDQASFDLPVFYNPELEWSDFSTTALCTDGIPYNFHYNVVSDNVDEVPGNNEFNYEFAQTFGRYSYHWQPSVGAVADGDIGPFTYDGLTISSGDIYANVFDFYQEEGEAFKIYGIRVFIPNSERVTFDNTGNGVEMHPVIYRYDTTANGGFGEYLEAGISAPLYQLQESDEGKYVYLVFDIDDVEGHDFSHGKYLVGLEIDSYNGQKIAIGVDQSYRQGGAHFFMKLASEETSGFYPPEGSVMIDVYTKQEQMNFFVIPGGVDEKELMDYIQIYPNPSTGSVTIKNAEQSSIYVYTITGELVRVIESESVELTVNLADLSNGSYLLKIVKENEVVTKKITLNK